MFWLTDFTSQAGDIKYEANNPWKLHNRSKYLENLLKLLKPPLHLFLR